MSVRHKASTRMTSFWWRWACVGFTFRRRGWWQQRWCGSGGSGSLHMRSPLHPVSFHRCCPGNFAKGAWDRDVSLDAIRQAAGHCVLAAAVLQASGVAALGLSKVCVERAESLVCWSRFSSIKGDRYCCPWPVQSVCWTCWEPSLLVKVQQYYRWQVMLPSACPKCVLNMLRA